jgi:hypothetical protein
MVEQPSLGAHELLQVDAPFLTTVKLEAENVPPLGADS